MAVRTGLIDRLQAGGVADARQYPKIRAEAAAREHAHNMALGLTQAAAKTAALAREKQFAAGGKWAARQGKKLAPVQGVPYQKDANGRTFDGQSAFDVLSEAYDD